MNRQEPTLPKVSIVIPVYNGSNFLAEAIDSALAQTYENTEVVVVDDGSNDDGATRRIALSYGERIKYHNKKNGGVASALNHGIRKMTGDYFSWLSHDDLYEPTKIAEQIAYLHEVGDRKAVIGCNAKTLFESGLKQETNIDEQTFAYTDIFLATSAIVGINGCALLIPKEHLESIGGFNESLPYTQDYDCWFRLSKVSKFYLLPRPLVISRRHEGQDSVKKQKVCFEASDKLHYDFLNDVAYKCFEKFFAEDSGNIHSYWDNYCVYKQNGYKKTASVMLKHILKYYLENDIDKYYETFRSEVGSVVGPGIIRKEKTKGRILFFGNVWHMGGIERVLSNIFDNFGKNYDCILVTCDDKIEDNLGYPLSNSVSRIKINDNNQIAELMDLLSIFDVDIFVGNPNFVETFLDIYPLLEETNVKSIAYNHGHYFLPYSTGEYLYPTALKIKESYRAADYVIWLSQIGCNIYNIENDNGLYIPNPVSLNKKIKPKNETNKNILAVGRFDDEVKRIDKILLVFKELHNIDPGYHLDIVGYCPMDAELPGWGNKTLGEFIVEQSIPMNNIELHGEQKDVSSFYKRAGFLVLTSRLEGFALVLTEALSNGVPCACFDYIGVEEIVQSGYNGWVCPQDDYIGLAASIAKTVENKQLFIEMSQNSIDSVKKFDEIKFKKGWQSLLDAMFGNEVDKNIASLKPDKGLSSTDYQKIVIEYSKLLNIAIKTVLCKEAHVSYGHPALIDKIGGLLGRFRLSLKRDGLYLTCEKVIRKVYKKVTKLLNSSSGK